MKLIVGFFTTKPDRREDYLAAARDHLEQSRLDPDCLYIELLPMPDHPDRILLAETFTGEEAHRRHGGTDHMRALWKVGPELLAHVVIDNVVGAEVEHIDERFD
ncbi:MAG: antibiotic biosynthesis monooxygenase [Amaricoccus sp.]